MATVTIFTTDDAFNNNISGFYSGENFLLASTTSSSNAIENDALWKFTTVGAGIGAGDTINSVTFWAYLSAWSDPGGVNSLSVYVDTNNIWGTLDASDPPTVAPSSGTNSMGALGTGVGWEQIALVTSIPKSGEFNIAISCDAADSFPGAGTFDAIETGTSRSPYPAGSGQTDGRAFCVIDYTPASSSHLLALTGVGR